MGATVLHSFQGLINLKNIFCLIDPILVNKFHNRLFFVARFFLVFYESSEIRGFNENQ